MDREQEGGGLDGAAPNVFTAPRRSEADAILGTALATVRLGGKDYEIRPACIDEDLGFRRTMDRLAGVVIGNVLEAARRALPAGDAGQAGKLGELVERLDLARYMEAIVPALLGEGLALGIEALYGYAPNVAADRERIEREASGDELEEAALTVIEIVLPFLARRMPKAMRMIRILQALEK